MKKKPERKKLIDECDKLWSRCILARDKTCRATNSDFRISAHHIRTRSHFATRFDLSNGLCLSWKVHSLQKFRPEQFHDMVIDIIGQEEYDLLREKSNATIDYSTADLQDIKEYLKKELGRIKAE